MVEYLVCVVVLLVSNFVVYMVLKNKYSKIELTDINELLLEILEAKFRNSSLSSAAESILTVLKRFYTIDYITILVYNERTSNLSIIASNNNKGYLRGIEKYCNDTLSNLKGKAGKVLSRKGDCLSYKTARERGVSFSSFTPLTYEGRLIGAILLENRDSVTLSDNVVRMKLYDKIFNSTALVLQNVIHTENLLKMVSTDQLTGVYNRRYIEMTLPEQFSVHDNLGLSFSVVMFDIDHFKKFNDTYGHQFGDLVLQEVSKYINDNIGTHDWVARYGGEEFVIFFGRSEPYDVIIKVEELREGLENLIVSNGGISASVTASFGIASFPRISGSATNLIKKADEALYESKRNGRNRVTIL